MVNFHRSKNLVKTKRGKIAGKTGNILPFAKWICVQKNLVKMKREMVSSSLSVISLCSNPSKLVFGRLHLYIERFIFRNSRKFTMNYRDMVNNEKDLRKLEVQPVQPTDPPTFPDNCVPLRRVRHVMLCYGLFGTVIVRSDWRANRNWKSESEVQSPKSEPWKVDVIWPFWV